MFSHPRRWSWLLPGAALLVVSCDGPASSSPQTDGAVSAGALVEISSEVGGVTPRWSPDGASLLIGSSELKTVSAEDGSVSSLAGELGGAGHFLASAEPKWSPDGEWVSIISSESGTPELWLVSTSDGERRQLTHHGGRVIKGYDWSPDGRWIVFSGSRRGYHDVWKVAVSSGEATRLTEGSFPETYPVWTPDDEIVYVRLDRSWNDHTVVAMDTAGNDGRVIVEDRDFFDYGAGTAFGYPLVSPDGERVAFPSYRSGWVNYWVVGRDGGSARPIAPAEADQSGAVWSPDGGSIAYVENHGGTHQLRTASVESGEAEVVVSPERGVIDDPRWSPDGSRLSYTLETPAHPTDLHVVSLDGAEPRRLTDSGPDEEVGRRLLTPEKVEYASAPGVTVPAYLYRPPPEAGDDPKPAIVWTHGGPTSQWDDSFEPAVQYFAQRGYVVLLPNVRGSSGYGRAFEEANDGCWGQCDLEDAVAGVEYLAELPTVDPERIGTTGTSYGGFMSCAAATFGSEHFAAVIAASGYCDRVTFFETGEFRHLQQLRKEMGDLDEHRDRYFEISPYYHVRDVRTPVFVVHGEGHHPGSPQMRNFFRELVRHGKTARYKAYPDENFYVYGAENRIQLWSDMERFFDYYLRDAGGSLPGVAHLEGLD